MAGGIVVRNPNTKKGESAIAPIVRQAEAIVDIKNDREFDDAWKGVQKCDEFLRSPFIKELEEHATTLSKAHKQAVALRDRFVNQVKALKAMFLRKRVAYVEAKEAADRKRREKEAADLAAQQEREAKKLAKQLSKQGDEEAAQQVIAFAKEHVPIVAPAERVVPKTAGSVLKPVWRFEIFDESLIPIKYRPVDESLVRKDVNTFGVDANIPGVRIWPEKTEHSRAVNS
jgi:hypothetical protein